MFVRLLLLLLLFSRSLPLSDWNTKLDSLSLVTGDTSYKSTFARVVRLEASCFLADGTPCIPREQQRFERGEVDVTGRKVEKYRTHCRVSGLADVDLLILEVG